MPQRQRIDPKSPQAEALRNEVYQNAFTKEGTFVAFPLCLPRDSAPLPADESHVTALDVAPNWMVYGGTSGRRAHLFFGSLHGATGMVMDMGGVDGATHTAAVGCGQKRLVAFVNGPRGGRALARALQGVPFDLLQEWGFTRQPYEELGEIVPGERIVHAIADPARTRAVGATERHLFTVGLDEGKPEVVAELPGAAPRLAVGSKGSVFGPDEGNTLWRFDPRTGKLKRKAVALPKGTWDPVTLMWARDPVRGRLYTADADGLLYSFTEEKGFNGPLGRAPFAPVGPMAVTYDGRVYGIAAAHNVIGRRIAGWGGDGICRLFRFCPATGEVADLGVPVSVLERRRYGYEFGDAVTGRDGQVVFGEDDDLGHLWLYFPAIPR
jgi:hypothetical protein